MPTDENNDGDITKDEFVENALKSDFIKNLIGEEEQKKHRYGIKFNF